MGPNCFTVPVPGPHFSYWRAWSALCGDRAVTAGTQIYWALGPGLFYIKLTKGLAKDISAGS